MPKFILITNQNDPALNQMCFEQALELLNKELEQGRECSILFSEKKRAKLGIRILEECELLAQGSFEYSDYPFSECNVPAVWYNKELLDNLKIEYYDKIQ